ncbi:MAG: hypothetical protein ACLRZ9_11225 [Eubacterium sp.]
MKINKKDIKKTIFIVLIFLGVSALFLTIFSLGTSCLYNHKYIGYDSDIFLAMGRFSREGLIPYKEFFDHKGPFIIFVQWLGYFLGNGKSGVSVIQILFLTVSLMGIYKILNLFYREKISFCLTAGCLLILNIYFDKGNLTEEYCLPFLIWSTYFAVKFFDGQKTEHRCLYSFFYGITFMTGAMTRLTNSLPIVLLIIIGLVVMMKSGQWKNIIKNAGSFIAGALAVFLPVLIYFSTVGALRQMIYSTFIYNFKHGFERNALTASELLNLTALAVPLVAAFLIGILTVRSGKSKGESYNTNQFKFVGITVAVLSGTAILFLTISRPYAHYLMVWLPVLVLAVGLMGNLLEIKRALGVFVLVLCGFVALGKMGTAGAQIYSVLNSSATEIFETEAKEIISEIPKVDRNNVIVYNVKAYFYLVTDVTPCYKNFILQDLHTAMDEVERKEFINDLESMKAKYIITGKRDGAYSGFIETNYRLVKNTGKFRLFIRE